MGFGAGQEAEAWRWGCASGGDGGSCIPRRLLTETGRSLRVPSGLSSSSHHPWATQPWEARRRPPLRPAELWGALSLPRGATSFPPWFVTNGGTSRDSSVGLRSQGRQPRWCETAWRGNACHFPANFAAPERKWVCPDLEPRASAPAPGPCPGARRCNARRSGAGIEGLAPASGASAAGLLLSGKEMGQGFTPALRQLTIKPCCSPPCQHPWLCSCCPVFLKAMRPTSPEPRQGRRGGIHPF